MRVASTARLVDRVPNDPHTSGDATPRLDLRTVGAITAMVWAQLLGSSVGTITWCVLIAWSITSPRAAVRSLILGGLVTLMNPALFEGSAVGAELRWVLLLGAGLCVAVNGARRVVRTRSLPLPIWCYALVAFGALAAGLALNVSYAPVVSLLKLAAFLWGFATVSGGIALSRSDDWLDWLYSLWAAIVLSSIPLLASPYGYWRNGAGFQGITAHPQTYGVIVAPPAAYLTVWAALAGRRRRGLLVIATVLGWLTLLASLSRTAVLAVSLAVVLTCAYAIVRRPDLRPALAKRLASPASLAAAAIFGALLIVYSARALDVAGGFLAKGTSIENGAVAGAITASVERSRGGLLEEQMANIDRYPFTGIGFGVASDADALQIQHSSSLLGVPLGASVEKGFLPTAVVEENGIICGAIFFMFLWLFSRHVLRYASAPAIALLLCSLLLNSGEMVFFSAGGLGPFLWLTMGVAAVHTRRLGGHNESRRD